MKREQSSRVHFVTLSLGLALIVVTIVGFYAYGNKEIDYTGVYPAGTLRCKGRVVLSKGIVARFYGAYDKQIGPWVFYFQDGKTVEKSGLFNDMGAQQGEWKHYREDGSLKIVDHWDDGQQVGDSTAYNEDGTVNCVTQHPISPSAASGRPQVRIHTINPPKEDDRPGRTPH